LCEEDDRHIIVQPRNHAIPWKFAGSKSADDARAIHGGQRPTIGAPACEASAPQ
jgi:hypothetical protein